MIVQLIQTSLASCRCVEVHEQCEPQESTMTKVDTSEKTKSLRLVFVAPFSFSRFFWVIKRNGNEN